MATRSIIVTGSNKGIGRAIVERLLREAPEFSTIIMTARDLGLGNQTKQQIEQSISTDGRLHLLQLDITDQNSIQNFVQQFSQQFGQIDVLLNNAGIAFKGSRFDEEVVRTTFNCNVFGTWNFTDSMLPYVKDGGHIINVTSMAGRCHNLPSQQIKDRILNPNLTRDQLQVLIQEYIQSVVDNQVEERGWKKQGYSMSKIFENAFTRVLSNELIQRRISVNACCPGWTRTDMAGQNAAKSPEEGAEIPLMLARSTGEETCQFWCYDRLHEWD